MNADTFNSPFDRAVLSSTLPPARAKREIRKHARPYEPQRLTAEDCAYLMKRIKASKTFAQKLLQDAGIVNKYGQLRKAFGGTAL